jgi:ADP-heptose:LPS heptosyltransferase
MGNLVKINKWRRSFMRGLTGNIGKTHADEESISDVKKVLICRPNHRLGNLLLLSPLLQEISAAFPESEIDLFVKGNLAPILFRESGNIGRLVRLPKKPFSNPLQYLNGWLSLRERQYDIAFNIDGRSSSGRLSVKFARATHKFFGDQSEALSEIHDSKHMAKKPVYNFRAILGKKYFPEINTDVPPLKLGLSPAEIVTGGCELQKLADVNNDRQTICLFTYATGNKRYPESWWTEFYEKLLIAFPDRNIVEVLPVENVSQISFRTPSYYSRDVREVGAFIANTDVFISADCGIMHLAEAVCTPVVGLFSVTNPDKYRPYRQHSVGINTNERSMDDCVLEIKTILEKTSAQKLETTTA